MSSKPYWKYEGGSWVLYHQQGPYFSDPCDKAHMDALREVTLLPIPEKQVETPEGWVG